ncbi:hypothetical protein T459_28728 [Capsicum annuum]|uniref:Xylanase inhibitor N-terminal domain-containing protein n=1 Tax=Capsicum annuum TaxID=4072 RepID=A0A2G2YI27_CAPAN|nr:hypothetical protein FXO37_04528 [Capsicum annuum]PHT69241.1 hypothetical protein T459_28728 [Capsicum annuum]
MCYTTILRRRCSTSQTGDLAMLGSAADGIFGLGQYGVSVIAQLSAQGVIPHVFSHCLRGSNGGGGILVFGQIVEPTLVYTPLVPSHLSKVFCSLEDPLDDSCGLVGNIHHQVPIPIIAFVVFHKSLLIAALFHVATSKMFMPPAALG